MSPQNSPETQPFPRIEVSPLSELAYNLLRERILSKELAPGERLDLPRISKQLGISKTPLREAIHRLEIEGLIEIRPRSGTFVSRLDPVQVSESFELRTVLETYAAGLAAKECTQADLEALAELVSRIESIVRSGKEEDVYPRYLELDHAFHRTLVVLSGNERLIAAHERENLHAQMARIRYRSSAKDLLTSLKEHRLILAALQERDAQAARQVVEAHLNRSRQALLEDMSAEND